MTQDYTGHLKSEKTINLSLRHEFSPAGLERLLKNGATTYSTIQAPDHEPEGRCGQCFHL